jgi:hypothetical protein
MSIIADIKALAEDVRVGRITSYTVHELAALARKLIEEIEHGNRHQAESQGSAAQEAGHPPGSEDSGVEAGSGGEIKESGAA